MKRRKRKKYNNNLGEDGYAGEQEDYFICKNCGRRISEWDFYQHEGLCKYCRGIIMQKGFPGPPGFPQI